MEHKPIYLDGVDVSKCYRYQKKTGYCKGAFKPEELPFCENFDCEFKQLARKTQECEELKEELATYKKILNNPEFRIALIDFKTGEREVWRKLGRKADRYRRALDEIEDYCDKQISLTGDLPFKTTESDILDIISKAKGEGND